MQADQKCFFLVDGGGSKTHARLVSIEGQILAEAIGGPSNLSTNFDAAKSEITSLCTRLYQDAGRSREHAAEDIALIGLAGAGASERHQELAEALPTARAKIVTDIDLTVAAALGESDDGVIAMLGTGSFFVWRENGKVRRAGGWGFELGDECGGAWLGSELFRAAIAAYDHLGPSSDLTQSLLAEFGGSPKLMVPYAKTKGAREFAQFAPRIFDATKKGDVVAFAIIDDAISRVSAILGDPSAFSGKKLVMLGGLAPLYQPFLSSDYLTLLHEPKGGPLEGAFLLAKQMV